MYVARKDIERLSGQPLDANYFSQTLLVDFMKTRPELTKDWIINWDERGHFQEPHSGARIGVGTEAVRKYLANRDRNSYGAILFTEKEGFDETFKAYELQERWDLAIMSSKGMSSTSARTLIEECSRQGVKIFCLHDFDVSGITILSTSSRDTERYQFGRTPEVIDLGLRLTDVLEMGLESEVVELPHDPSNRLLRDGATEDEIEFLRGTYSMQDGKRRFQGNRVELNALTNPQLIEFIERKLKTHGVTKVIPDECLLRGLFFAEVEGQKVKDRTDAMMAAVYAEVAAEMEDFELPEDLHQMVEDEFTRNDCQSWKNAIRTLATNQ
jgi:hypothetical protein